jgi:hypothetical protein
MENCGWYSPSGSPGHESARWTRKYEANGGCSLAIITANPQILIALIEEDLHSYGIIQALADRSRGSSCTDV